MKRLYNIFKIRVVVVIAVLFMPATLSAQSLVDSTLVGRNVFEMIEGDGSGVRINRSPSVEEAFPVYLKKNAEKKISGYRIRIFFDNKQTARVQSGEVEEKFKEEFPHLPVYRTYTNPYFKVAVGDFRSKSDAVRALEEVKRSYPKAFIIKDMINYPL